MLRQFSQCACKVRIVQTENDTIILRTRQKGTVQCSSRKGYDDEMFQSTKPKRESCSSRLRKAQIFERARCSCSRQEGRIHLFVLWSTAAYDILGVIKKGHLHKDLLKTKNDSETKKKKDPTTQSPIFVSLSSHCERPA